MQTEFTPFQSTSFCHFCTERLFGSRKVLETDSIHTYNPSPEKVLRLLQCTIPTNETTYPNNTIPPVTKKSHRPLDPDWHPEIVLVQKLSGYLGLRRLKVSWLGQEDSTLLNRKVVEGDVVGGRSEQERGRVSRRAGGGQERWPLDMG